MESAVANAETKASRDGSDLDIDELFIQTIYVDAGPSLRRFRPRAQGRATKILKKTKSHGSLEESPLAIFMWPILILQHLQRRKLL